MMRDTAPVLHRRPSPCIGVCSTTYGDLVCRGCNRFAHEVVQWNAFDDAQRTVVWRRLDELRDGALARILSEGQVRELCASRAATGKAGYAHSSDLLCAYEELRRLAVRRLPLPWEVREADPTASPLCAARRLLTRIDREFHNRSLAVYERSFKISAE